MFGINNIDGSQLILCHEKAGNNKNKAHLKQACLQLAFVFTQKVKDPPSEEGGFE